MEGTGAQGMVCPICRVDLVMGERQGVEIDYCPKCRGVWLDRGELDTIVERAVAEAKATAAPVAFLPPEPAQAVWRRALPRSRRDTSRPATIAATTTAITTTIADVTAITTITTIGAAAARAFSAVCSTESDERA